MNPKVEMKAFCCWEFGSICIDTYVDEKIESICDLTLEEAVKLVGELTLAITNYKRMEKEFKKD